MGLICVADKALDIDTDALLIPYVGEDIKMFSCRDRGMEYKNNKFKSIIYFNANNGRLNALAEALKAYRGFKRMVLPYSYLKALGYSVGEAYDILLKILVGIDSDFTLILSLSPCFRVSKKSFYNDILKIEGVLKEIFNVDNKIIEKEKIRLYREDINEFMSLEGSKCINYEDDSEACNTISIKELSLLEEEARGNKYKLKDLLIRLLDTIEVATNDERNTYLEYGTHLLNKIFLLTNNTDALLDSSATNVGFFIRNRAANAKSVIKIGKADLVLKQVITQKQIEDYENERTACSKFTIYKVALFLGLNLTELLQLMTLAGQGFSPLDSADRVVGSYYLKNHSVGLGDFLSYITNKAKGQSWLNLGKDVMTQFNVDALLEG